MLRLAFGIPTQNNGSDWTLSITPEFGRVIGIIGDNLEISEKNVLVPFISFKEGFPKDHLVGKELL